MPQRQHGPGPALQGIEAIVEYALIRGWTAQSGLEVDRVRL
jgi:hypothetical protein